MMHSSLDITFLLQVLIVPTFQNHPFQGKIPIGGIFDIEDVNFRTGFRFAVSRHNGRARDTFTFESLEENSTVSDSFNITYQLADVKTVFSVHVNLSLHTFNRNNESESESNGSLVLGDVNDNELFYMGEDHNGPICYPTTAVITV
ncbi:hypothetical protein ScPMuIL_011192 [Solemya velum]